MNSAISEIHGLAGVLASLQVSSAEHGLSDNVVVGIVTALIRQDGNIRLLQLVSISSCRGAESDT